LPCTPQGWGGISSPELPDGFDAWVHFSAIEADGYRTLAAGQDVEFDYEPCTQDSWRFRATRVVVITPWTRSET
jgi:cold shock protein